MAYTQTNRFLSCTSPFGADVLLLTAFDGEERMGRPFRFTLEFLSENAALDPKAVVGKPVGWSVQPQGGTARHFHGVVKRFSAGGQQVRNLRHYRAEVVPTTWFLGRTADCRIFQNKAVPDILKLLLQDAGVTNTSFSLSGTYPALDYCVQYRETDLDFAMRLMEEVGIFTFVKYASGQHTVVFADAKSAYAECAEKDVDFQSGSLAAKHISAWEHAYEFRSGKWAQTDYNFETPSAALATDAATLAKVPGNDKFELFDYPGRYGKKPDGTPLTKVRMEEEEANHDTATGVGACASFSPGHKFTLKSHVAAGERKGYVLTAVRHRASDESHTAGAGGAQEYVNEFTCIPDSVTYRPPRTTPRPVVRGPQTAVVVGPKGEEIYTDKYGRVKVQFFWDRLGKSDENSSCWVRVSQNWAGKTWGIAFHPRIGQEVIVDFLEGDPDRPIITGRVYNAEQMPPYALPANQTQSTIKTRSSKGGTTDNFNELRFEDKKGSEEVYFHAEKDFNRVVENNDTLKVGSSKAPDGSQTIEIWKDRTETVKTGNETITIEKGNRTESVKTGNEKVTVEKGNRDVNVQTGNDTHKIDKGNRTVEIGMGNDALTIKMGNRTTKLNLGADATEAMQKIELKVGQSSIVVDQKGVTIKGLMIQVEGTVQTQLKGLMTQIDGTAMLMLKGGITMLD